MLYVFIIKGFLFLPYTLWIHYIFQILLKYTSSTPNSSTTADSGVDNPGFRIENEGLSTNDLNEMTCKERDVTRIENDKFNNIGANRLTSTTNATDLSEHPDSAIWSKSTFSKKYKTHSADSKGTTIFSNRLRVV